MTASVSTHVQEDVQKRAIRLWLYAVAAMVLAMVLVGGATRLTESGLSITEWRPVMGALPPMTEAQWLAEFHKYQEIPQYREFNQGMSLAAFKTIYWWEWTHRLLGRLIGVAFLLPFLWFLWGGWVGPGLRGRLWFIFGLGALQGAVGWWMVASGLVDRVEVSQYRLATHLILACAIYVAILWTGRGLDDARQPSVAPRIRVGAISLLILFRSIWAPWSRAYAQAISSTRGRSSTGPLCRMARACSSTSRGGETSLKTHSLCSSTTACSLM
jgi:heme a synthase